MKTKGILLIAFLALLLHDGSCVKIPEYVPTNIIGYELLEKLGNGSFSVVIKAKIRGTEDIVALKIIDETKLKFSEIQALSKEAEMLKMLDHPNIIKLFGQFEDKTINKRYIVMECASRGTVAQFLKEHRKFTEEDATYAFQQIVNGVEYLHKNNIVHRDLKPANLLVNTDGVIKLGDFGFATNFTTGEPLNDFPGSPEYASPEMIQLQPYNGPMAEVWTIGVVFYELVSGKQAFNPNKNLTFQQIKKNIILGKFSDPPGVSPECIKFIRRFIVKEPKLRCTLKEIKSEFENFKNMKNM